MIDLNELLWPPDDFVEYYAAGRLNALGQNPYDPELLLPIQDPIRNHVGEPPVMMWNPPWTLTLVMPLGLLPPGIARLIWIVLQFSSLLISFFTLWRCYLGRVEKRWIGLTAVLMFVPTIYLIQSGQISGLLLLGWVGVFGFLKADRPGLAGMCMILPAFKPHLFLFVWLAVGIWALAGMRWRFLLGTLVAVIITTAIPLLTNPSVLNDYWEAMVHRPPIQWKTATLGTCLRMIFGLERFGLQFIPPALGLIWLAIYAYRRHADWDWFRQFPVLMMASIICSPYGCWHFDLVLLIWPITQMIAQSSRSPSSADLVWVILAYLAVNGGMVLLSYFGYDAFWYIWVTPAVLILHQLWEWRWSRVEPT